MGVKQQYDERTGLFISGTAKDTPTEAVKRDDLKTTLAKKLNKPNNLREELLKKLQK